MPENFLLCMGLIFVCIKINHPEVNNESERECIYLGNEERADFRESLGRYPISGGKLSKASRPPCKSSALAEVSVSCLPSATSLSEGHVSCAVRNG